MKKIVFLIPLLISLIGCDNRYDQNLVSSVQPCVQQGYSIDQCVATYRQFGQSYSANNEWINYAAAFAAGAASNHWWNRQNAYNYNPSYWDSHPRVTYNTTNVYQQAPQQQAPQQQAPQVKSQYNQQAPVQNTQPTVNNQELIAGQKVQPLFQPNVIAPNLANKPQQMQQPQAAPVTGSAPKPAFNPIQVQAPVQAPKPAFNPIQVQAPVQAPKPAFNPIQVQAPKAAGSVQQFSPVTKPATSTFKPVQVTKPKK